MWNPNSLMELKLKSTICHLPRGFQQGPFPSSVTKISLQHRSTQAIWPLMPASHARGRASEDVQVGAADAVSGGAAGARAQQPQATAAGTGGAAAGVATCRAPPAAPACPSCHGCAWPGRARAAWRGPAPRSAPPVRTWRGC